MKKLTNSDKVVKYIKARSQGKNKKESVAIAGYSASTTSANVEAMDSYKSLSIKSALLQVISIEDLTREHLKNIVQDEDKGAKNKALEMAYDRIEPKSLIVEDNDKVTVILKG